MIFDLFFIVTLIIIIIQMIKATIYEIWLQNKTQPSCKKTASQQLLRSITGAILETGYHNTQHMEWWKESRKKMLDVPPSIALSFLPHMNFARRDWVCTYICTTIKLIVSVYSAVSLEWQMEWRWKDVAKNNLCLTIWCGWKRESFFLASVSKMENLRISVISLERNASKL